jgi:hypothetical protein
MQAIANRPRSHPLGGPGPNFAPILPQSDCIWRREQVKRLMLILTMVALLEALLACAGYAARDTQLMRNWHPMFIEPALGFWAIILRPPPHKQRISGGRRRFGARSHY